jgi:hypothetical protein
MIDLVIIIEAQDKNIDGKTICQTRLIKYPSFEEYKNAFKRGESEYKGQRSLPRGVIPHIFEESDHHIYACYVDYRSIHNNHRAWVLDIGYDIVKTD